MRLWKLLCLTVFCSLQLGAAAGAENTTESDHRAMMKELGITSLRPGANPNNPAARNAVNYDEAKANPYPSLPDPLVTDDGQPVTSAEMWWTKRRAEIVEHFDREVYGRVPANAPKVTWEVVSTTQDKVGDTPVVIKKLVGRVYNADCPSIEVNIDLTLTTPADASGPVPVMIEFGFNFPPGFRRPNRPVAPGPTWQEQLLARGWGYAILIPNSIQADNGAGLTQGVIGIANRGQLREPDDWGALRAWAWGASRALDYLETDPAVDAKQVGIEGLSRYGKAALVAMAYDPRFAIGFIGSSGEGGAKLHRRTFGELVENLTGSGEYHWMAGNFLKYGGPLNAGDLPVDAHELIALCAPRPVFVSYGAAEGPGAEGQWVDQRGSFMAEVAAGPVYRLLGKRDLGTSEFPPVETALVDGELAWRQHSGGHTTGPNWPTFLAWADRYVKSPTARKPTSTAAEVAAKSKYGGAWAAQPAPQENPMFLPAHEMLLKKRTAGKIDVYFLGDSITRRWQGTDYPEHKKNWDQNFHGWNAADFGWGGDTTRNVLWRLAHGELEGVNPQVIVLMIGTNNVGGAPPPDEDARAEDVAAGIRAILDRVREQAPQAKIVLMGITPRNDGGKTAVMPTIDKINARIEKFADGESVVYLNINDKLADADGKLRPGVTEDGLHLSIEGYQVWADALEPLLTKWLGPRADMDEGPPASGVPTVGK